MDTGRNLVLRARVGKVDVWCCDQVIDIGCPVGELHPDSSNGPIGHLCMERQFVIGCADTGTGEPPFDLHNISAR